MTDEDVAEYLKMLRECKVTLHVRGTDRNPVVEYRDKRTRKVVGGIEMKKRIRGAARNS